ncbi:MAG: DUF2541 family protein [Flavobacteriaceae bacterium]|nr:DUF2541 family protein [Flavobacteriaceae bacterium]
MKAKILPFLLGAVFFITFSSFDAPVNSGVRIGDWELLGSRKVNYKLDRDVIYVGAQDGRFKRLKFQLKGGSLNMHRMVVHYANGSKEEIALKHNFGRRSGSRVIDLKGNKRIIEKVVFVYDSKNASRRRATVHLFGKH